MERKTVRATVELGVELEMFRYLDEKETKEVLRRHVGDSKGEIVGVEIHEEVEK